MYGSRWSIPGFTARSGLRTGSSSPYYRSNNPAIQSSVSNRTRYIDIPIEHHLSFLDNLLVKANDISKCYDGALESLNSPSVIKTQTEVLKGKIKIVISKIEQMKKDLVDIPDLTERSKTMMLAEIMDNFEDCKTMTIETSLLFKQEK